MLLFVENINRTIEMASTSKNQQRKAAVVKDEITDS